MNSPVKAFDYSKHAHIAGPLTDRQIDIYVLQGHYGTERQQRLLARVESGKFKSLDAAIRDGKVCPEAQQALNRRVVTPKRNPLPTTAAELLALLDM